MKSFRDYSVAEKAVVAVFKNDQATAAEIDEVLEGFLATRENRHEQHGYWVHSLSHFTDRLWSKKMFSWIKRFNLVAFRGAVALDDPNCSDRLVGDFVKHADWSMSPADFGMTPETMSWFKEDEYNSYKVAYIAAAPFVSEVAFLLWKAGRPETYKNFDGLVPVDKVKALFDRLKDLGADVSALPTLQQRLSTQLAALEVKLAKPGLEDWVIDGLKDSIAQTKAALGQ
jgi:hypothetical protein